MITVVVLLAGYWIYTTEVLDDYLFVQRLEGIGGQRDDSLERRGYSVYFDGTVSTFLFGLGQLGAVYKNHNREIHSTIFSFFANYGVIGGTLFLSFIILWLRRIWQILGAKGIAMVAAPIMLYGITHNGSRFAIFWVIVAVCFSDAPERTRAQLQ